jgi:hypothetical protein
MKVLVTGGTNGMGKGVAKVLAAMDNQAHEIIILCRSKELGEATIEEFEKDTMNNKISIVLCDLTKLSDVKKAIIEIQSKHTFLDAVFINAGLGYAAKRVETEDGMDSHFQVNYLSQFMLTLNILNLLEKSQFGGRVIFNTTENGEIFWDDMQMKNKWSYEDGIHQGMVAKRMFLRKLHNLYKDKKENNISFIGFQISEIVWTNQINIIPAYMRIMATMMKFFGKFITLEKSGKIMAPLFYELEEKTREKSGKFITYKNNEFIEIAEDPNVLDKKLQDKLWNISLVLCGDNQTKEISNVLLANV